MSGWWFWLIQFSRRLLVRAAAYAAFAVLAALAAVWFAPLVPREMAERFGGEAVEEILRALASSMLAVATFSLSAMVVAYTAVSAQMTPRAASFVTDDGATQRALATFVGSFLFTIVALVAIGADYYGPGGRTILFFATLAMVAIVAVTLIGWIDRVTRLAQYDYLLRQVEQAALKALRSRCAHRYLGGRELVEPRADAIRVCAQRTAYVGNIDPAKLQNAAERLDAQVEVLAETGDFVARGEPLAAIVGISQLSEDDRHELCAAFTLRDTRTFEQDPLYACEILVEVAARALSPGVNDPGTAILAGDACQRVVEDWARDAVGEAPKCAHDRLRARHIDGCKLLRSSLSEIARYGAGDAAVAARLQRAFADVAAAEGGVLEACAKAEASLARERAERALELEADRERVRAASRA